MSDKKRKLLTNIYIIIAILITIVVLGSVIKNYNFTGTHDGYIHTLRIIGVSEIIKSGQFPPIIESDFCNGYAINLFYNPLTTYIPIILEIIFNNYIIGIKIMLIILMILAAAFMYIFLKNVTNKKEIGIAGAIFYITNPYYLSNIYVRGAVGEVAALTFIPLLFLGLYNLFNSNGKKHYFISISAIGLLLTHNITTLYAAIMSVIYILFNIKKLKEIEIIKKIIINIIFIIGVTLFFIYPLGLHKICGDYVVFNSELLRTNGLRVSKNVLDIKQLFTEIENQEIIFKFNIVQLLLFLPFVYFHKFIEKKDKKIYLGISILAILCVILTIIPSIWSIAPDILCTIQFPWRMLGFANFFMSTIAAINLVIILRKIIKIKKENVIFILIPIVMISTIFAYTCNYKLNAANNIDKDIVKFIENNINNIEYQNINREYMPSRTYRRLQTDEERISGEKAIIISGDAIILSENKKDLNYIIELENIEKDTIIEIPFLYYVGYNAYFKKENGEKIELELKESEYGFVEVKLNNEISKGKLIVEYKTPVSYYIVYIISIISFIGLVIYIIIYNKNNQ